MTSLLSQRTFTPKDVADFLKVGTETVLSWIHSGALPASDCSRKGSNKPRWRVLEEDLEIFLGKRKPNVPPKVQRRRKKANVIEFFT